MLALQSAVNDDHHRGDPTDVCTGDDNGFPDFSDAHALLDGIDFDDLFLGMDDADLLPDMENMDPELLADFSLTSGEESSDVNTSPPPDKDNNPPKDEISGSGSDEIASKKDGSSASGKNRNNSNKEGLEKSRKSSCSSKNSSHGKRKVKVDWTPELHRRFVQAVEQLGVDKAVPSRILDLMGIDCLTRHNIASHLQKYRSHRKHLLAREAEAASWTQRRQMYGGKRAELNPWAAQPPMRPTLGFPPTPPPPMHHFRPLHVWGHPSVDPSATHVWPKHPAPPLPPEPPFWHHQRALTPGTPCFPPPIRFRAPPVPGIPPHAMYKLDPATGAPGRSGPPPTPLFDIQPSKESIDAAIGDVLSKPWLPLPIGLKPPSTDSVMGQLQLQGVPKVPPATTCAGA